MSVLGHQARVSCDILLRCSKRAVHSWLPPPSLLLMTSRNFRCSLSFSDTCVLSPPSSNTTAA